jgi:uncharacterized protein (TIGR00725 family)
LELLSGQEEKMKRRIRTITVFGSSRPRESDNEYATARQLGAELAKKGFSVCTGGYGGVMEAVSRGAHDEGDRAIGVTARFFKATANMWLDKEIRVKSWRDRLFELIDRGDGYVVCAGGTGTLVEFAAVWEMMNKSVMAQKPVVVLGDFWKPVIDCVRQAESGPESPWIERRSSLIQFAGSPSTAADMLAAYFKLHPR